MARTTTTAPPNIPVAPLPIDHRFVYNGETITPGIDPTIRSNRPVRKRQRSPFIGMFGLLAVSCLIVFYIWNKIMVGRFAKEVDDLQNQYQKIVSANEVLKAEITQKSRLERIEKIAVDKLKLSYPKEQPTWFDVDEARIAEVNEKK